MAVMTRTSGTAGWHGLALAAAAALALAGCAEEAEEAGAEEAAETEEAAAEAEPSAGPVRIGALMPMTGDLQAYGETSLNGVKLAAQQINADGGVLGHDLQIKLGDTQTKPQAGIDAAKKLVSIAGVSGIVGALSSGVTIPVAKSVTSKEGVPQISGASTSPVITGLDDNDFMFRTVPSDAFQGKALAEVVSEKGMSSVSVLYVNNDYGEGLADSFESAFKGQGGSVGARTPYEKGAASYRGELSKLAGDGVEALVLIGYPESGVTILRQALEGGHFGRFVFTDGLKAPEIIEAVGAGALDNSFGTAPQALTDTDAAKNFRTAYEAEYGELPPKPFIDTAYDATFVLAMAAEAAESTDGASVRDHLRAVANPPGETILPGQWSKARRLIGDGTDVDYSGASGPVDFDDNGDVSGTFAHWKITDGKIETIKVFEPGG